MARATRSKKDDMYVENKREREQGLWGRADERRRGRERKREGEEGRAWMVEWVEGYS